MIRDRSTSDYLPDRGRSAVPKAAVVRWLRRVQPTVQRWEGVVVFVIFVALFSVLLLVKA